MALSGSTLVVPIVRSTVALRASTGRELWRYEAPLDTTGAGGVGAGPGAVVNTHIDADAETVYIPAWGASVSAVDLATGAVRWIWRPTRTQSDTAVAGVFRSGSQGVKISGDTVYATAWHFRDAQGLASEAWLIALERTTGRELWRVTMPAYTGGAFVWGSPVVAGNLVIFESNGGHEYAIDRFTQQLVWEFKPSTRNATMAQTELYEGVVYHDGGDSHIYALRAADGTVLWRAAFDGHTTRDLLVTARRVIFTNGYSLHVHDRQTGRRIVRVQQPRTADSFFGSPAAYANGQVFVTVGDGAWSFDEP